MTQSLRSLRELLHISHSTNTAVRDLKQFRRTTADDDASTLEQVVYRLSQPGLTEHKQSNQRQRKSGW